ncbi:heavy metal-associated isoprenylated plant protein 47-like isoform X1 [Musa acuminata AAA Group]|uniref:heavy metal-associated isoprenylated plant protein 47-like isoform X1 n=1 Tax=Musa acuminata AAA Group TaxID=214697 RepID=UPI0031E06053
MKQKIVIRVQIKCDKCRSKAMQLVAEADGVDSVAIEGENKDQLVIVGDGVDPANVTLVLRKKVGRATIVKVEEVKKDAEKKPETTVQWYPNYPPCPQTVWYDCESSSSNPNACSIM